MKDAATQVKSFESMTGRRMARHERAAMMLSEAGKLGERDQLELGVDYTDQHVRLSAVHARQDLVLVVSYLDSLNATACSILGWIAFIGYMATIAFVWNVGIPILKANNWWPLAQ
jgi:hypothetical protein